MKRKQIENIDRTAFYTLLGAKVIDILGKPPDNTFVLAIPDWILWYEKLGGFVPYKKYAKERTRLKVLSRKKQGLPPRYKTKKKVSFKFGDIVDKR